MESKVNFTIVGLFTLTLVAVLIAILLWLGTGGKYLKIYDTYYAYMNESVSGLNLRAPIKYRGVEVGNVREISLDAANSEQVKLVLNIERGAPVKEDSVAVLRTQGLTGIAFVELTGGSLNSPLLKPRSNEEFPVIHTGPSLMTRMDTALTSLMTNVNRVSDNINSVLDEDNRRAFKNSLAQIDTVTRALAARSATIDAGLGNAAKTMENSARASAELGRLIERVGRSADAIERLANETSHTAAAIPNALQSTQLLVDDLRELGLSLHRVSTQLERNPEMLLFGKSRPEPGPGE